MPLSPVVDSHIHIIDHAALPYGWVARLPPTLRASRGVADYRAAIAGTPVTRAVMVEFLVDSGHHLEEAAYASSLAAADPLVAAFVANVPVERGAAVNADLDRFAQLPAVRGVRRILEVGRFDEALAPGFISGVRAVGERGLPFELGVDHTGLSVALELARRCPDTTFVLDHLGTPPITGEPQASWSKLMRSFAALPNVRAKLSGLLAGVDPADWHDADVVAHLRLAIDCFGPSRVMYGSDWPMFTPLLDYSGWLGIVEAATPGLTAAEQEDVFSGVATRTYRLAGEGSR